MVRRRNLLGQFVVYVVTLGFYGIYWFYSTLDEMVTYRGERAESCLWTIALFIPIVNLFALWKYASTVDKVTNGKYPSILMWLLGIFVFPAVWVLVQLELNSIADNQSTPTAA